LFYAYVICIKALCEVVGYLRAVKRSFFSYISLFFFVLSAYFSDYYRLILIPLNVVGGFWKCPSGIFLQSFIALIV